jgi:hypothetical protein
MYDLQIGGENIIKSKQSKAYKEIARKNEK